jgi:hypothetical protein
VAGPLGLLLRQVRRRLDLAAELVGLRTSTRFFEPMEAMTSSRKARIDRSAPSRCSWWSALRDVLDELAPVELPLLAPAVEQLDVRVAVQLELPVGVGGEPVVVAAVQHDGVVVADALLAHQLREVVLVDQVADLGLLQLRGPVQAHGAGDVAAVVGGHVLVHLDEDDRGVLEMGLGPVGVDEHVCATHGVAPS